VQNVQYHPFGGVKSYTLGNGQIYSRSIDLDGRIASYTLGSTSFAIAYDAASRITGIGANTYGYDDLDRITSEVLSSSNYGYSYDAVGNRLSKTTGASSETYTYGATSNRIATVGTRSFVFDANGSTEVAPLV
jgi:YD repeat-containing protein